MKKDRWREMSKNITIPASNVWLVKVNACTCQPTTDNTRDFWGVLVLLRRRISVSLLHWKD